MLYFILSLTKILKILYIIYYNIGVAKSFVNAYLEVLRQYCVKFWSQLASVESQSHFNVPQEHVTVIPQFSCGPPEFKPITDNNHITAPYIKDLAYCSAGSHSGTFQKSIHSRALTGSMLCIKCVTPEKYRLIHLIPDLAVTSMHCTGFH